MSRPGKKDNKAALAMPKLSKGEGTQVEERKARFSVDIPESLRDRVKLHCIRQKTSMTDWVAGLLEEALEREGAE